MQFYKAGLLLACNSIPVARGGSRGSVEPPFRVTGSKYFSDTPHITSGISSSFNRAEPALELSAVSGLV